MRNPHQSQTTTTPVSVGLYLTVLLIYHRNSKVKHGGYLKKKDRVKKTKNNSFIMIGNNKGIRMEKKISALSFK